MGYFKDGPKGMVTDEGLLVVADEAQYKIQQGNFFTMGTHNLSMAADACWSFYIYADATMYPKGVEITNWSPFADSGYFKLEIFSFNTFSFATYSNDLYSWCYPWNHNMQSSNTLSSVTMATVSAASSPTSVLKMYKSAFPGGEELDSGKVILSHSVGYQVTIANDSATTLAAAVNIKFSDSGNEQ